MGGRGGGKKGKETKTADQNQQKHKNNEAFYESRGDDGDKGGSPPSVQTVKKLSIIIKKGRSIGSSEKGDTHQKQGRDQAKKK